MGTLLSDFTRVSMKHPCPICGKSDWCLISRDCAETPSKAICARVESRFRWGDAGFLHTLGSGPRTRQSARRRLSIQVGADPTVTQFDQIARRQSTTLYLPRLAHELGVSQESLARLGVGWLWDQQLQDAGLRSHEGGSWTFPMSNAAGAVIGLRVRYPSGRKLAIPGSHNGLFLASGLANTPRQLFVAEGESDAGALLDLGVEVVGRPGCQGGTELLARLVRRVCPREVVIVADNDERGREGADRLAARLVYFVKSLRVITPPEGIKDARAWKKSGLTRALLERAVEEARPLTVTIRQCGTEVR